MADTGSNYSWHYLYGDNCSSRSGGLQLVTSAIRRFMGWRIKATHKRLAKRFSIAVLDILDYANTNKYKMTRALDGTDANGSGNYCI
jgi:hypothetical protein